MRTPRIVLFAMLCALAMGACASGASARDGEQLALYRAHAMPAVQSFRYLGRIDGWTPLGDDALAVWTSARQAYLLELSGPCPDLAFAQAISLTSQSGLVHARFDKVIPRTMGSGAQPIPCHIREIRPLDVKALKAAQQDARQRK